MGSLVWDTQMAYIHGCDIFYRIIIAFEAIQEMRCNGEGFVLKIDFKKAYDCMDTGFIFNFFFKRRDLATNGSSVHKDVCPLPECQYW